MTSVQAHALPPSPWLSVWFSPRNTIERIVASNPRRHVLPLAALAAMSAVVLHLLNAGATTELLDWRIIAIVALVGATLGIANLYLSGLLFSWGGRVLGGRASATDVRAAFAWGAVPNVASLAICLAVLAVLSLSGGADVSRSASRTTFIALQASMGILALWALIATMLMLGRLHRFGFWRTALCVVLGGLATLLLVLVFRSFLYQPFNTPSGSMKPTFLVGDHFFVSKFRYGYSKYSLPFSPPLFSGRVFASEPQLGDVVVFRLPRDPSTDYVKRIVGLPRDTVQMLGGVLQVNGQPVKRERIADLVELEGTRTSRVKQWRETLPNGASYTTLDLVENGFYDNTPVYQVPAGHYFVLGDNRDNSTDSRVRPENGGIGYVPFENLVGRAEIIFQSIDGEARGRQPAVRFERFGAIVR
jgi:signal peptidase I